MHFAAASKSMDEVFHILMKVPSLDAQAQKKSKRLKAEGLNEVRLGFSCLRPQPHSMAVHSLALTLEHYGPPRGMPGIHLEPSLWPCACARADRHV